MRMGGNFFFYLFIPCIYVYFIQKMILRAIRACQRVVGAIENEDNALQTRSLPFISHCVTITSKFGSGRVRDALLPFSTHIPHPYTHKTSATIFVFLRSMFRLTFLLSSVKIFNLYYPQLSFYNSFLFVLS
jgi:hypothetical protein